MRTAVWSCRVTPTRAISSSCNRSQLVTAATFESSVAFNWFAILSRRPRAPTRRSSQYPSRQQGGRRQGNEAGT